MNMPQPKPPLTFIALIVEQVTGIDIADLCSLTRSTPDVQRARWVMGTAAVALGHSEVIRMIHPSVKGQP